MNEKTNALLGLLKGKNEIRNFKTFDYTNKFQIEIKDNFPNNIFHQKIPFVFFILIVKMMDWKVQVKKVKMKVKKMKLKKKMIIKY